MKSLLLFWCGAVQSQLSRKGRCTCPLRFGHQKPTHYIKNSSRYKKLTDISLCFLAYVVRLFMTKLFNYRLSLVNAWLATYKPSQNNGLHIKLRLCVSLLLSRMQWSYKNRYFLSNPPYNTLHKRYENARLPKCWNPRCLTLSTPLSCVLRGKARKPHGMQPSHQPSHRSFTSFHLGRKKATTFRLYTAINMLCLFRLRTHEDADKTVRSNRDKRKYVPLKADIIPTLGVGIVILCRISQLVFVYIQRWSRSCSLLV